MVQGMIQRPLQLSFILILLNWCTNSGRLVTRANKFCTVAPHIVSINTDVSLPYILKSVSVHTHRPESAG
jgi:hypothetical protein